MEDAYLNMDLLRFTTAGSVDDGKSTLIGRLLYDSKSIFEDQMEAIEKAISIDPEIQYYKDQKEKFIETKKITSQSA